MFGLTTLPVHCCSTTDVTTTSSPTLVTLLAKRKSRNITAGTQACSVRRQIHRLCPMALTILMEQRDFVSAGVCQSCGCEALSLRSFSVTPYSSADMA